MKDPITVSLCISTYNRHAALQLCLESVLNQSRMPDEILVGDDGSTDETRKLVGSYIPKFKIPLIHLWQPDDGFRLASVRNVCFREAKGTYVIQIDGDTILEKRFIEDHILFSRKKTFLSGSRSLINEPATKTLEQEGALNWDLLNRNLTKQYNAIRFIPLAQFIYYMHRGDRQAKHVLGSNMSFWKEDLISVNGYNEDFKGWGAEDQDIAIRLLHAGVGMRFLKYAGVTYHLHHMKASDSNFLSNFRTLSKTKETQLTFVEKGIRKSGKE